MMHTKPSSTRPLSLGSFTSRRTLRPICVAPERRRIWLAEDYDTFKRIMREERGFIRAYWCGSTECEGRIKEETRATIRVIPEDAEANGSGFCVYDGKPARGRALFAQSY